MKPELDRVDSLEQALRDAQRKASVGWAKFYALRDGRSGKADADPHDVPRKPRCTAEGCPRAATYAGRWCLEHLSAESERHRLFWRDEHARRKALVERLMDRCRTCDAGWGQECITPSGRPLTGPGYHASRLRDVLMDDDVRLASVVIDYRDVSWWVGDPTLETETADA